MVSKLYWTYCRLLHKAQGMKYMLQWQLLTMRIDRWNISFHEKSILLLFIIDEKEGYNHWWSHHVAAAIAETTRVQRKWKSEKQAETERKRERERESTRATVHSLTRSNTDILTLRLRAPNSSLLMTCVSLPSLISMCAFVSLSLFLSFFLFSSLSKQRVAYHLPTDWGEFILL